MCVGYELAEIEKIVPGPYNAVFRSDIGTGKYSVLFITSEFEQYLESNDDFISFSTKFVRENIDIYYTLGDYDFVDRHTILTHFQSNEDPIEMIFCTKAGKWIQATIIKDRNFSEDNPVVICVGVECEGRLNRITDNIVNRIAMTKMYVLALIVDREERTFQSVYSDYPRDVLKHTNRLDDFLEDMRQVVFEEDYDKFLELLTEPEVGSHKITERDYRSYDFTGNPHIIHGSSTYISLPMGNRVLLLASKVDERSTNREQISSLIKQYDMTRDILYALGDSYFGIYYCNLVEDTVVPTRDKMMSNYVVKSGDPYGLTIKHYTTQLVHAEDASDFENNLNPQRIAKVLRNEGDSCFHQFRRLFDDEYRWVRVDIQAVKCRNRRATEVILAFKDINEEVEEEKKREQELQEAVLVAKEANKAKTVFLSSMSHDIRTPLNAIIGMTDIAKNHFGDEEVVKSCLDRIDIAGKELLRLVNSVLDMSAIEYGKMTVKPENFSLKEVMNNIISVLRTEASGKNITLECNLEIAQEFNVFGDRMKLTQILNNIIGNAIKYTDNGGLVKISLKHKNTENSNVGMYIFEIQDNGRGIPKDQIETIYEPFNRGNDDALMNIQGTGLGMTITRRLTELLGGTIRVDSEYGIGTCVTIEIPFEYISKTQQGDSRKEYNFAGLRILTVDDNAVNLEITADYLEDVGIETVTAEGGIRALEIIAEDKAFDMILTDVRMPLLDGYELTKRIRAIDNQWCKAVPIIALTAHAFSENYTESIAAGMNDHISKPINTDILYSMIEKYAGEHAC